MSIWIGGGLGVNFGSPIGVGGWGGDFGGCCNRMLGPNRGGLTGMLAGGLVGSVLGGGNLLGGLVGATLGGLIGQNWGAHNRGGFCNSQNSYHQGCASYPPAFGGGFGGPQFGGYNMPMNYGSPFGQPMNYGSPFGQPMNYGSPFGQPNFGGNCGPSFGQPMWGGPGYNNPNFNFNFGHQCPPSQCTPCPSQCGNGNQRGLGQLSQEGEGKPISYTTSGGYKVVVNGHDIIVTDPSGKNEHKTWGDPHENLNGKHIKDWQGKQRSIVLGDGTKITMTADGPQGVTETTSIYDGRQNVQITNRGNKVTNHSYDPRDTMFREMSQYDGETALFRTGYNGVATFDNIYNQDDKFNITSLYQQLGRTGGFADPGKVHDFYDDPRVKNT